MNANPQKSFTDRMAGYLLEGFSYSEAAKLVADEDKHIAEATIAPVNANTHADFKEPSMWADMDDQAFQAELMSLGGMPGMNANSAY